MNKLHEFLSHCHRASLPILGESFSFEGQADLMGIFTAVEAPVAIEITGYEETADYTVVADKLQFLVRPRPPGLMLYQGARYQLINVREDQSSYSLDFKLIEKQANPGGGLRRGGYGSGATVGTQNPGS